MIEVGNIYEVTEAWTKIKGNPEICERMPIFKPGTKFKIVEVEENFGKADATAIVDMATNEYYHIEDCPISDLVWCFFSHIEEKRGYITLVDM